MELKEEIRNLLKEELDITVGVEEEKKSFFESPFYMAPRELLYIHNTLERYYKITFTEHQIENYGFLCFENVVRSVKELREGRV